MVFLDFSTYENMNKDENLSNTDIKPKSRIWGELILTIKSIGLD